MGLGIGKPSSSQFDMGSSDRRPDTYKEVTLPNPNPMNYQILKSEQVGHALVVMIQYPDCTNFEGKKICVFRCTLEQLMDQKAIDPHFCDDGTQTVPFIDDDEVSVICPYARFKPTKYGWEMAMVIANKINEDYEGYLRASWGIY
jgi:hypothetical protein